MSYEYTSKKCSYSELFWSVFSHIHTAYGEIRSVSLYSVQMPENTDQNNSKDGHFSRSDIPFDEGVMIGWLQNDEDSYFNNPPTPDSDGKLFFVEIHRGQQILKIKRIFKNMKTQLGNISGDLTSYVQVLDVVVNKLFKSYVRRLYEKHVEENLELVKKVLQKDKH